MLKTNLHKFLAAAVLTGVLGLMGCVSGGGDGTSAATSAPLAVLPATSTAYHGTPSVFTITGGMKNYSVFSDNAKVISFASSAVAGNTFIVNPENVSADTVVHLSVTDGAGTTKDVPVTVKPVSLVSSSLKVTVDKTSPGNCSPAICNGGTGLVEIQLLQSANLASHNVKLDVIQGDYGLVSGTATVNSLTATTDSAGYVSVGIKVSTTALTQYAILKATDLSNGSVLQTTFVIAQSQSTLSVVPDKNTLSNANLNLGTCSSSANFNYYVFGGTPPYRIVSSSDQVAKVSPGSIGSNGGGFTATTVGTICGDVTFVITDATGRTITATLTNSPGTYVAPTPTPVTPATLTVSPASYTMLVASKPQTATFNFVGGTAPYSVSSSNQAFVTVAYGGGLSFTASSVAASAAVATNTVTLTVLDSAGKTAPAAVTFQ